MKIYTKIRLDIDSWKVLQEESYEYDGDIAYCDSTSSSSLSSSSSSKSSSSSSSLSWSSSSQSANLIFEGLLFHTSVPDYTWNQVWYEFDQEVHTLPTALNSGWVTGGGSAPWDPPYKSRIDLLHKTPYYATLKFFHKVRTSDRSSLNFYINDVLQEQIYGDIDWTEKEYVINHRDSVYWAFGSSELPGSVGDVNLLETKGYLDTFTLTHHPASSSSLSSSSRSSSSRSSSSVSDSSSSVSNSSSSSSRSSSSTSSSSSSNPAVLTSTYNFNLENSNNWFTLKGPNANGLWDPATPFVGFGRWFWEYEDPPVGSGLTGPQYPQKGQFYWYTNSNSMEYNEQFTMELDSIIDSSGYDYKVT